MTDTFKPVRIRKYYINEVAKGVQQSIYESFFKPLFAILGDKTVTNSTNAVIDALRIGKIYYENGAFKAVKTFSNEVALELEKLGAKFKYNAYYINRALLPLEIDGTIAFLAARDVASLAALDAMLVTLAGNLTKDTTTQYFIKKTVEMMFASLQYDLEKSTKEKKTPIIDLSVQIPNVDISDETYEAIDQYYSSVEHKGKKPRRKGKKGKGKNKDGGNSEGNSSDENNGNTSLSGSSDTDSNNPPESREEENTTTENPTETTEQPPEINLDDVKIDERSKKIAKDYTYNMNYWVKNWKAKEIVKMRRTILDMTQKGVRRETISKYLQKRWKIAKNKADFLARNESGIASSVIKATHYQELGCNHFKWLKSISKEKRELHLEYAKETNNQYGIGGTNIFAFNDPPIIEQIEIKSANGQKIYLPKPNGQKGLPQQTYNCECDFVGVKDVDYYINQEKQKNAERNVITKITNAIGKCFKRNNPTWRYRRFGEGETF